MPPIVSPSDRAPLAALFPAAVVAGLGLGLFVLETLRPAPEATPIPLPSAAGAPLDPAVADRPAAPRADWAPLFGTPAPVEDRPEPVIDEPEPWPDAFDDSAFFDPDLYVLRGVVVDGDGGWALIETEDGVVVLRPGDFLPDGVELLAIAENGIEVRAEGEDFFIGFADSEPAPDGAEPDRAPPQGHSGPSPYGGNYGIGRIGR